jgi:hypothetical protein
MRSLIGPPFGPRASTLPLAFFDAESLHRGARPERWIEPSTMSSLTQAAELQ